MDSTMIVTEKSTKIALSAPNRWEFAKALVNPAKTENSSLAKKKMPLVLITKPKKRDATASTTIAMAQRTLPKIAAPASRHLSVTPCL